MKRDRVISKGDSGPFVPLTGVNLCFPLRVVNDIPVQNKKTIYTKLLERTELRCSKL